MSDANRIKLVGLYARLLGIRQAIDDSTSSRGEQGKDYNAIIEKIGQVTGEEFTDFALGSSSFFQHRDRPLMVVGEDLKAKLYQTIRYLELVHHLGEAVVEIGTLYRSIQDETLRSRCVDLLSAPGGFDRVVNQATQVLEDRIRTRSGLNDLVGIKLVAAALSADPANSRIVVSAAKEEQEGFSLICRGLFLTFRNPTHHRVIDKWTREQALKLCAFIDNLLHTIDSAKLN